MTANAGCNSLLDLINPSSTLVSIGDIRRGQFGYFQIHGAARDVIATSSLDDDILCYRDDADGNAVTQMHIRHQIELNHPWISGGLSVLSP